MKKIALILFLVPAILFAQEKEIKPNVNKAENARKKGKFDEAKAIIDATVANQEYMTKDGKPSKNAAKAWYIRGLIYAGIDTTKVQTYKSLDPDPYKVAEESFAKSRELDNKTDSYIKDAMALDIKNATVEANFAQAYLNVALDAYQKQKDYKKAFKYMERVVFFLPKDTTMLLNAGVYFGPAAEEFDKSLAYIKKYHELGGHNSDSYIQQYSIHYKRKEFDTALKIAQDLTSKYPENIDYLNMEYNLYTQLNRLPEAKTLMEKKAAKDPNDKEARYFLGLISNEMKNQEEAKKWMNEAVKIDPTYFEAYLVLAKFSYGDAKKVREQRNDITGSKDADIKKRQELFKLIHEKLKESVPYWDKCAELKPNDEETLYGLLSVYGDLAAYDETYEKKVEALKKKMKGLGMEVD
jgi:tetratricopeptide (TPR) repeat protein